MRTANLKSAGEALFSPDATTLYLTSNRTVKRLDLGPRDAPVPRASMRWSTPLTYTIQPLLTADGALLVTRSTYGVLYGLDTATGAILWTSDLPGKQASCAMLPDDTCILATAEGGVMHLNARDGALLNRAPGDGRRVGHLQSRGGRVFGTRAIDPKNAPGHRLCTLDVATLEFRDTPVVLNWWGDTTVLDPLAERITDCASVGPKGSHDTDRHIFEIRLHALPGSERLATCTLGGRASPKSSPVWSPDGRWIAQAQRNGLILLNAADLATLARFESDDVLNVAVSPDGTLICLVSFSATRLIRTADLLSP